MNKSLLCAFCFITTLILTACGAGSTTGFGASPSAVATPAGANSGGSTNAPSPRPTATTAPVATPVAAGATAVIPALAMPLTHNGRWLTDADGRVVIFHGINVAYKSPPYTPQAQGFTQADAAMLAREGFSNVRLWIWWQAFEPSPGVWDDSSLAATKQFIGWLQTYGITVRLNFAQVVWGNEFGGIGFPDWGANTDGLTPMGFGSDVYTGIADPALHQAWQNFYDNEPYPDSMGLEDHLGRAWEHVAQYFKGTPGITAYDIVNEPEIDNTSLDCNNPAGCPEFDTLVLTPMYERVTAAIRTIDPTTMIDYEPYVLDAVGLFNTYVGDGSDKNVSLTFHYYPQTDEALTTTAPLAYEIFENDASNHNSAVELTEYGATDDLTQITDIINACDQQRLGWLYWAFYSTEPTGNPKTPNTETLNPQEGIVYDPTQPPVESNLKVAKLDVLDRPYPFLVSGTPTAWAFDTTTNTFTLTYSTTPVAGGAPLQQPTVVVVPQRLYPMSYTAAVSGATITSAPGAMALTLQANPGATTVNVTVTPK